MNRNYRTRHASQVSGWGPAPGWGQPLPGWSPLVDHGPLPVRMAGSVARWWWPFLALAGFGIVTGFVVGHDHPSAGLSTRGLLTIALAALVVVLFTIHRTAGPWPLARAAVEYTAVALLAGLLALAGSVGQPSTNPATSTETKQATTATPQAEAGNGQPGVLRVTAGVIRAVTGAVRAVTGAVGWVADLWRQADQATERPSRSPSTTTAPPTGEAMPRCPAVASTSTRRPL